MLTKLSKWSCTFAILTVMLCSRQFAHGAFAYSITIRDVPGASYTDASDINDALNIVGGIFDAQGGHGYLRVSDSISKIDVPGSTWTSALGINNSNQIVGFSVDGVGNRHGYLFDGLSFTPINVPGSVQTEAFDINDAGRIVGNFMDTNNVRHGFLRVGTSFTIINVPGAAFSAATGINSRGQIVGFFGGTNGMQHGFLTDAALTNFTTIDFPGASLTSATGINDAGVIGGQFETVSGRSVGFVMHGSTFSRIESPAFGLVYCHGPCNSGELVGLLQDNQGGWHAFIARPSSVHVTAGGFGSPSAFSATFTSRPGHTYDVDYSGDLRVWYTLFSGIATNNVFTDVNANVAKKFYRVFENQ